jgi:hypothetical protein
VHVIVGFASTASVAVAVYVTLAPSAPVAFMLISAGTVNFGAVLSCTVTMNVPAVAAFPALSLASQVTVVGPNANVEPEAGVHDAVNEPSTKSLAVAVYVTIAPFGPVASIGSSVGSSKVGAVVSCTVTLNDFEALFSAASVAVQVTSVVPNGNVVPESCVHVIVGDGSLSSVAETS